MNTEKQTMNRSELLQIKRIFVTVFAIYLVLVIGFHFLAGDQLLFRRSRGTLEMPAAEAGTVELVQGVVVEQSFQAEIQRLQSISVQWATYYRGNAGTVTMELYNQLDGSLLMSGVFDVATIVEGQVLSLSTDTPLENLFNTPLLLRIYADSLPGSAATPLMNTSGKEGTALLVNGNPISGTLCFSVDGEDYIWTGLHYWKFAAVGGLLLLLCMLIVFKCYQTGKHSYVINACIAVKKYKFLIKQLVSRYFKTKYKRSVLGVFWSFLNPLLMMTVQYFVFSTIFKSDIPNYPAYLLIGIVCFNFFSEACGMALTSVLGNANLITKVYMPKYIYPLTRVMSSVINLAISLIPLLIVATVTGVQFKKSVLLTLFFLLCLVIFSLGLGLLLSTSMVFFRDTQFLWGVMSMVWMYATPIFYPETILPQEFRFVLQINPLYHFLKNARICILNGISPEPIIYFQCMVIALAMLLVGALVFRKGQDKFVLYL